MISVEMSVRDMVDMATVARYNNPDLYEQIVKALTSACSAGAAATKSRVTVVSMNQDRFIPCIKALRLVTGYGLKEAKDFFDVVRGPLLGYTYKADSDYQYGGGQTNSIILQADKAKKLFDELGKLGCVVTLTSDCSV
jgi:ribosomal protein L7/L12